MVNIQDLIDDAKCYQTIRDLRWPEGLTCPHCSSGSVIKNGRDDIRLLGEDTDARQGPQDPVQRRRVGPWPARRGAR